MSWWPRMIVHADMDAFYASVEQRDAPELRGRPVLVGGRSERGVVAAASYEARRFGVHSAMPMSQALRRCPEAVVCPPRMDRYRQVSQTIMTVFETFSDRVEALSLDEAFLDLSASGRLFASPEEMGQQLKRDVLEATQGLRVSVGIAGTKFLAKVASDHEKPDGLTLVPDADAHQFLAPLSIKTLWGVGKKTEARLHALGLHRIADIQASDRSYLTERLGTLGTHLHGLARNHDPREVTAHRPRKSISSERTLEHDVCGQKALAPLVRELADDVARQLRKKQRFAGGVRIKLKTSAFVQCTRQRSLKQPSQGSMELRRTALALLRELNPSGSIRLVGVGAYDLRTEDNRGQLGLFATSNPKLDTTLDKTLDAIEEKFGSSVVKRGDS